MHMQLYAVSTSINRCVADVAAAVQRAWATQHTNTTTVFTKKQQNVFHIIAKYQYDTVEQSSA